MKVAKAKIFKQALVDTFRDLWGLLLITVGHIIMSIVGHEDIMESMLVTVSLLFVFFFALTISYFYCKNKSDYLNYAKENQNELDICK